MSLSLSHCLSLYGCLCLSVSRTEMTPCCCQNFRLQLPRSVYPSLPLSLSRSFSVSVRISPHLSLCVYLCFSPPPPTLFFFSVFLPLSPCLSPSFSPSLSVCVCVCVGGGGGGGRACVRVCMCVCVCVLIIIWISCPQSIIFVYILSWGNELRTANEDDKMEQI